MIECRRGSARELYVHTSTEAGSRQGCWEALWLSVGIVSLADYKTQVWRFGAGQTLAEASPARLPVSGCERQEVKGIRVAETQDVLGISAVLIIVHVGG